MQILEMEPPKHADIRQSLAPIIVILRIFGLYNNPHDAEVSPTHDSSAEKLNGVSPTNAGGLTKGARKTWRLLRASRCYSVILVIILFANAVKFFTTFFSGDSFGLGFKIVVINWYIQNVCNALCMVVSSWRKSHLSTFYQQWLELFGDPAVRELGVEATDGRKSNATITLTGCLFMLFNVTVVFTTMLTDQSPIKEALQHVLTDPLPTTSWGLTITCILHILFSASWTLTNTFVVCICSMIGSHFQRLTAVLANHIVKSKGAIPPKLRELRICHLKLCQLVDTCNRFLKFFLAVNYSGTVVGCCFLLYQLVNNRTDVPTDTLNIFWLITNLVNSVALSISLSKMHEAAHEPLENLLRIECSEVSDQTQALQIQLFLTKLTGTQIGASVMDLFIVTKEALLTIAGAYVTYFFLLFQFKI